MEPLVFVVIVNFNGKEHILDCLESLQKVTYPNFRIVVSDNGSIDGSVELIKEKYPSVKIIENGANLGYGKGNNVGIKYALEHSADYVLLLNLDTIVKSDFLTKLVETFRSYPTIGICGPKVMNFPRQKVIQSIGGTYKPWKGIPRRNVKDEEDHGQYREPKEVDWISGSAIMIKREVFERIGLLDERFFLFYEETDFCCQAAKNNFKIVAVPQSVIFHKYRVSTGFLNRLFVYYYTRNALLCMKKNAKWYNWLTFLFFFLFYQCGGFFYLTMKQGGKSTSMIFCGIYDFLRGNFGKRESL